eukprot:scaffold1419_cov95-Isochrysis_galbana.AAC.2
MGDPSRYPEIRHARHIYALQWLPRAIRDDVPLLRQWIDNNMSYLDALVLEVFQYGEMLTFVGTLGPPTITSTCAALACAPNGFGP